MKSSMLGIKMSIKYNYKNLMKNKASPLRMKNNKKGGSKLMIMKEKLKNMKKILKKQ